MGGWDSNHAGLKGICNHDLVPCMRTDKVSLFHLVLY